MTPNRISLALVLCLTLALLLFAVEAEAQSPFALTDVGQRIDPGDARMVGRGGWGMAVSDSLNPGFKNLSGLAAIRDVVLKFSAYGDHVDSKDELNKRNTNRTISPDIRVALPILKARLAFSAGFEVSRSTEYQTRSPRDWYAWGDTITGNEQFIRGGSTWTVPLSLSVQVLDGLALGGAVGLENGSTNESVLDVFLYPASVGDGTPLYESNARAQQDEYNGTSITLSALISPFDWLKLGGSYAFPYDLDVDRKVDLGGVGARYSSSFVYTIPEEIQAGLDLRVSRRWHIGGDYQQMDFTSFTGREDWAVTAEKEYTYSVGLERAQLYDRRGGWNNLPIRLGYQYRQWAYQVGGNPVIEKFYNIGTGFPFREKKGQLDVSFSYGIIGGLEKNGQESKVWRLAVSVTGLERWW